MMLGHVERVSDVKLEELRTEYAKVVIMMKMSSDRDNVAAILSALIELQQNRAVISEALLAANPTAPTGERND